ncbi:MAG: polysaccharide pyruvyl transferase family protein [Verrucomicrobiota bacterium]
MRVGHLTLLHGYNYGGMLQAWATQEILRSHGHEVITLDYHPARRMQLLRRACLNFRPLFQPLASFSDKLNFSGVDQFNAFRARHFTFSKTCSDIRTLERACRDFDAVVVGSDQVWSPDWIRAPYFVDFDLPSSCRRVSLAACCGRPCEDPEYRAFVARTLSRFNQISVRNEFTADLVRQTTGKEPAIVCDPTLATEVPAHPVPGISGPYILAYIINRKHSIPLATEALLKLKRQIGLPVYSIPPAELKGQCGLPADRILGPITPFQWNHLIANASWLVTDSFHGTIFALKNHRNFTAISSGFKTAGRLGAILSATGLTDQMVTTIPEGDLSSIVPETWLASDSHLFGESRGYHEFLAESLATASSNEQNQQSRGI